MAEVYLDNSATTPVDPDVAAAMRAPLGDAYGNPSSPHGKGLEAERAVKTARERVAAGLHVPASRVFFTSGGTEANNLAVVGAARALRRSARHVVTTAVEHSSVLEPCRALEREGWELTVLPVDAGGAVDPDAVAGALRPDTALVSVMYVNNEIGTVQPVPEIARIVRARRGDRQHPLLHVDAVQALGKLPLRPRDRGVDMMSVSGHKVHGPKGVGALYVRDGVRLQPLLYGGDQQHGLRPGTENVPAIVGMGRAVELAARDLDEQAAHMRALRRRLLEGLTRRFPEARVHGPRDPGAAPHIVNAGFPGLRGEVLVNALADRDVYVSTGSACHSRRVTVSHVLEAVGTPRRHAEGALRISLSRRSSRADVDALLAALDEVVPALQAVVAVKR